MIYFVIGIVYSVVTMLCDLIMALTNGDYCGIAHAFFRDDKTSKKVAIIDCAAICILCTIAWPLCILINIILIFKHILK